MKIAEGGIYSVNEKIDYIVQASWRRLLACILMVSFRISTLWPTAMAENFSWFTLVPPGKLGDSISYDTTTSTSFPIYRSVIISPFDCVWITDNVVKYTVNEKMQRKIVNSWRQEDYYYRVPPTALSRHPFWCQPQNCLPFKTQWCVCARVRACVYVIIRCIITFAWTCKNCVFTTDFVYVSCESQSKQQLFP